MYHQVSFGTTSKNPAKVLKEVFPVQLKHFFAFPSTKFHFTSASLLFHMTLYHCHRVLCIRKGIRVTTGKVVAFSSLARILGKCSKIHSLPALSSSFFKVEIRLHTLIPLFRPGSVHSGSASGDDHGWVLRNDLPVSSFTDKFQHFAWSVISPLWLQWVKGVCVFRLTSHLYFWQNDQGLSSATAITGGVERTPHKSQHKNLTLEKKILLPFLSAFKLTTFHHESGALPTNYPGTGITV